MFVGFCKIFLKTYESEISISTMRFLDDGKKFFEEFSVSQLKKYSAHSETMFLPDKVR